MGFAIQMLSIDLLRWWIMLEPENTPLPPSLLHIANIIIAYTPITSILNVYVYGYK